MKLLKACTLENEIYQNKRGFSCYKIKALRKSQDTIASENPDFFSKRGGGEKNGEGRRNEEIKVG